MKDDATNLDGPTAGPANGPEPAHGRRPGYFPGRNWTGGSRPGRPPVAGNTRLSRRSRQAMLN